MQCIWVPIKAYRQGLQLSKIWAAQANFSASQFSHLRKGEHFCLLQCDVGSIKWNDAWEVTNHRFWSREGVQESWAGRDFGYLGPNSSELCLSNSGMYQNLLEALLKQPDGLHPQSSWFSRSGGGAWVFAFLTNSQIITLVQDQILRTTVLQAQKTNWVKCWDFGEGREKQVENVFQGLLIFPWSRCPLGRPWFVNFTSSTTSPSSLSILSPLN